ncbi:hypothetical protein BHM03_00041254 [Ensete ventricosum]|nr:hypothetical protein BHM03_00041254 [Ensete ventricosum]
MPTPPTTHASRFVQILTMPLARVLKRIFDWSQVPPPPPPLLRFPEERELLDGDGDSSATAGCAPRTRHMVGATGCGSNPTSRGRGPRTAPFIHPQLDTGASRGGTTRQMRRKRIKATVTGGAM